MKSDCAGSNDERSRIRGSTRGKSLRLGRAAIALALVGTAGPAFAGPPYLTDDPVPTAKGHWEIYAFTTAEGHGSSVDDDSGFDLNYGPAPGIQLTATLPLALTRAPGDPWRIGTGDVELGVKYRFYHDEKSGLSAAIFPRAILPTAANSPGEKTRFLLPLWIGKDLPDGTSIFGGGGVTINPGLGNRDFWQAGLAATHDLSKVVSIGAEITRQGAETRGGGGATRLGVGSTFHLSEHASFLFSGGPTWTEHRTDYRFYAALGLNF